MLPIKYWGNFYVTESLKIAMKEVLRGGKSRQLWLLTSMFWHLSVLCLYFHDPVEYIVMMYFIHLMRNSRSLFNIHSPERMCTTI